MKINSINSYSFTNNSERLLDKFHTHTQNAADMNDTVVVPRTIFKGYLGFMVGTTLTSLGVLAKGRKWLSYPLNIAGLLSCLYGTWSFVRPYVLKDAPGVAHTKEVIEPKHTPQSHLSSVSPALSQFYRA